MASIGGPVTRWSAGGIVPSSTASSFKKDGQYVLPSTLFDAVEQPKKKAMTIPPRKRSVTKKSFLWGLYTITREE